MTQVAITGVGVVSAIGCGFEAFAEAVTQGVSGLGPWSHEPTLLAAELVGWQVNDYLVAEKTYLDRCSELALAAAKLCLDDAGLDALPCPEERAGVVLGTRYGCGTTAAGYAARVRQRGVKFATPVLFTHAFANTPASLLAIDFHLRGHHATVTAGAASGSLALHAALVALACGHADALLAGGAEALSPELLAAHRAEYDPTDDPDEHDPFATAGLLLGEGAGLLLLEPLARATARGARIRGLLDLAPRPADLILCDANGTAPRPHDALCAAPKGLYGECWGASGALAAATALAALATRTVPPVRGGEGSRESRGEPYWYRGLDAVRLRADDGAGGELRLTVSRP
ncbi:MAG: hypothetical protein IT204_20490 [Fimbriimonadaceae bacterium]|nr:hypothetical protein [Fimbriimonadaceae bacterium]